jgi:hypothetical protein
MKTTLEIPDPLFRRVKVSAAERGQTLKQFVTEALHDKLCNGAAPKKRDPQWMKLFGALGKTAAMRAEMRRVDKAIEEAFEQIEPEDAL